ncbi:hypothetical protein NX059_008490 [Plenodomus lindquistii]|nr:hypothetical protein NX059_008490 [Plenodomus lindquistii]
MRYSSTSPYTYDHASHYAAHAATPPRRPAQRARDAARPPKSTWPPSPSVEEDEGHEDEGQPPANTRGTVDQDSLLHDLTPPYVPAVPDATLDDRRFVLVSEPTTDDDGGSQSPVRRAQHRQRRRQSVAERGNLAHIRTTADAPPVILERISTPYAYSKPQLEATASARDGSSDSDVDADDATRLRTQRQPARYSFVKSDLHREDLRANSHAAGPPSQSMPTRRGSKHASPSSKHHHPAQSARSSPRSSASSLGSSPKHPNSSTLPIRSHQSPPSTRPPSRGNGTRPTSPLISSAASQTPASGHMPVTEAGRYATYPPPIVGDRPRPLSSLDRAETLPEPAPRVHVARSSPFRQATAASSLPYPVDDRSAHVCMPTEEHYQFDHATVASPRHGYTDSPVAFSSPVVDSPTQRATSFPFARRTAVMPDVPSYARDVKPKLTRPDAYPENGPIAETRSRTPLDIARPLPSCPRSTPSRHDDWYSLRGYENFDVCPTCYDSSFSGTQFAGDFSQNHLYERSVERVCDFSNPWMRIAWLLTIKQGLRSLELFYMLAEIAETERPCPGDREVGSDRVDWYGLRGHGEGQYVANFAVCSRDQRMLEALFPSMRRLLSRLPTSYPYHQSGNTCSFRTSSRRSRAYLDLLMDMHAEAQSLGQPVVVDRFVQSVRSNAYKSECSRDKAVARRPWHFIPALPEFTVCEECYDELIWPALHSRSLSSTIPGLFNKTIQLVPGEDPEMGSSCYLYSPRMRSIWDTSIRQDDFSYLTRSVLERKRAEENISRERKGLTQWMLDVEPGSRQWERARSELSNLDKEWAAWA